jgi:hypothetical protein
MWCVVSADKPVCSRWWVVVSADKPVCSTWWVVVSADKPVVCGGLCSRIKNLLIKSFIVALCDIYSPVLRLAVVVIMIVMKSWDCNGFRTDHSISEQIKILKPITYCP